MIHLGDKKRYVPTAFLGKVEGFREVLTAKVEAEVVYINWAHRWYRTRYETPQGPQYECFPLPCEPDPEMPPEGLFADHRTSPRLPGSGPNRRAGERAKDWLRHI